MIRNGIETGFILDRQWYRLRGEMEGTKRSALLALARIFAGANVPYAIIGGVALQVHQAEPRTTLDIAVAVATYGQFPRAQLEEAGLHLLWTIQSFRELDWTGGHTGAVYR